MQTILQKHLASDSRSDLLIFVLITSLAVFFGSTTPFYVIYFFWWNELIHIIVDYIFSLKRKNYEPKAQIFSAFFLMFIYGIFIIVIFGFITNWKNESILITNMKVLFFKNWFFNMNLIFVLIKRIYYNTKFIPKTKSFNAFTPNMIVLHISIILGTFLMFFVVKKHPTFFNPDNLLGSVIIILPFLILRVFLPKYLNNNQNGEMLHKQ